MTVHTPGGVRSSTEYRRSPAREIERNPRPFKTCFATQYSSRPIPVVEVNRVRGSLDSKNCETVEKPARSKLSNVRRMKCKSEDAKVWERESFIIWETVQGK